MHAPTVAPYGTWPSIISAERIAAGAKPLSSPRVDGSQIHWLEGRASEGGRLVVRRAGVQEPLNAEGSNVRTRVHEYGGGAYLVSGGVLYHANYADNRVIEQVPGRPPRVLTGEAAHRHADLVMDAGRQRLIAVREDHSGGGHEPRNMLVALPLAGGVPVVLAEGHDFYAAPRLSPDGSALAWLAWNHPQMPWQGTELWQARIGEGGLLETPVRLAGGADESLCQPLWSPGGELFVVSDRTGWWNLYRADPQGLQPVCPMEAEFGEPPWVFGQAMYGFAGDMEIIATCIVQGMSRLGRIDLATGRWQEIPTPFTSLDDLHLGPGFAVALAGAPTQPQQLVRIDLVTVAIEVLARSVEQLPDPAWLSRPISLDYASPGGHTAHAFYYPPTHPQYSAPAGELPPLIVTSHGGPTSRTGTTLKLALQYWTSRGFAVLDVNYAGSTGYGRPFRDLLHHRWGVVDVEDCVAGARHAASLGLADRQRMAIRGSSASGFTTLAALAFHDTFKAGASHYGVSDLAALDADTHKFESRYTQWLVAEPADRERVYRERSPVHHADKLDCPVIFFQGLDDKVVPPAQSEAMVQAMRARGVRAEYLSFEGEGHGFRQLATIRRTLEAELAFYASVFGFAAAEAGPSAPAG